MSYTVGPTDTERDQACVLELWRDNFPEASAKRYAWLYGTNTAAGWLARSSEGEAIGAAGLMQRRLRVALSARRGSPDPAEPAWLRAGQAIDLNVAKDHRTALAALSLQRAVTAAAKQGEFDLLYAFPNAQSEPVLRRAGYRTLGNLVRWVKPLRLGEALQARLRPALMRPLAAAVANPLLWLKSPEVFYRRPRGVEVFITDHFDARFDALWRAAAPRFSIVGERTAQYLTWRFAQCPAVRYLAFCLADARGEIQAYLVYHRRGPIVYLGDFFFAEPRSLARLFAEFLRFVRMEKAEAVATVYLGGPVVSRQLRRFGFWQRPSQWKALLYVPVEPAGVNLDDLFREQVWHLTQADVDTDL